MKTITKPIHGQPIPEWQSKGLQSEPPVICTYKLGDVVTYTNEYGAKFPNKVIIGFASDTSLGGRFIHLAEDAWWFPVKPSELSLMEALPAFRVTFDDGQTLLTSMAKGVTLADAEAYYVGQSFEHDETKPMHLGVKVEQLS